MQNYLPDNTGKWERGVNKKAKDLFKDRDFRNERCMAKMFIVFLKINIQGEFVAKNCCKWAASILHILDEISAPLKMLTVNENINTVKARLTNLKCYY